MIHPRRQLLSAFLGAALGAPWPAFAQPKDAPIRIGWLGNTEGGTPQARAIRAALLDELQRRGWVQGRNLTIEFRFAEGVAERYPLHARQLVDAQVDLIVAVGAPGAAAARQATKTIPVVFVSVDAPVEQGLVSSLARPGGNLTGQSTQSNELVGKRLQLLKEAFPRVARVAVLDMAVAAQMTMANQAAMALGLQLTYTRADNADELATAIAALPHADAWFVNDSQVNFAHRRAIVEAIARQRKPAIYPATAFVREGGLMAYSVDLVDQFRRAGEMVDRILRGTRPADIPVEQPTKFVFAVNLSAARAQGLTMPQTLLLRADELIE